MILPKTVGHIKQTSQEMEIWRGAIRAHNDIVIINVIVADE